MIPNNFCVERFADVFFVARFLAAPFLVAPFLVARFLVAIFFSFGVGNADLIPGRYSNEINRSIRFWFECGCQRLLNLGITQKRTPVFAKTQTHSYNQSESQTVPPWLNAKKKFVPTYRLQPAKSKPAPSLPRTQLRPRSNPSPKLPAARNQRSPPRGSLSARWASFAARAPCCN